MNLYLALIRSFDTIAKIYICCLFYTFVMFINVVNAGLALNRDLAPELKYVWTNLSFELAKEANSS